jgi:predicted 3-demethylubiquinone-9 3-methyltransferase (glyoxalase superfamily)
MIGDPDKAKADRVMNAMMEMTKIDIAALKRAADKS